MYLGIRSSEWSMQHISVLLGRSSFLVTYDYRLRRNGLFLLSSYTIYLEPPSYKSRHILLLFYSQFKDLDINILISHSYSFSGYINMVLYFSTHTFQIFHITQSGSGTAGLLTTVRREVIHSSCFGPSF